MRKMLCDLVLLLSLAAPLSCWAQATARPCGTEEVAGPACLMASQPLPSLTTGPWFWHIDKLPSRQAAVGISPANSTVVEAFGKTWLFTIERKHWRSKVGDHVSVIGPLPLRSASSYTAEYLRSVFTPGMKAPLHFHSGPEAFYAIRGDTCLETPNGMQLGRGPGNTLMIEAGPPMLLMAIGHKTRQGFALVLHDAARQPTTLIHDWHPKGLCQQQLMKDGVGDDK